VLGNGRDAVVRFSGAGLFITALAGDTNLGRVWVDPPAGATLKGGRGDVLLVPAPWLHFGLDLLVEATGAGPGRLESVRVGGPLDLEPEA
jgi:hypothetical protein